MEARLRLSATEKLLHVGRAAFSNAPWPVGLERLAVAVEHMHERAFPRGAVLAREGEPTASCYSLVGGRVRVSRRGSLLGEAGPGSPVGLAALLSQDQLGLEVVAATDVRALQIEADLLFAVLGDQFPLLHDMIRVAARRLLALSGRLPEPAEPPPILLFRPPSDRPLNLVELLLFLRTPGAPFERCGIDGLAELAATATQVRFEKGHRFWREGEPADRMCLVVAGSVACASHEGAVPRFFRVGPGRPLGNLEAMAGDRRWFDAVAETAGLVIEQDVEALVDLFEDDVDVALDYLAWLSRTTLDRIEEALGPGPELLQFLTTFSPP